MQITVAGISNEVYCFTVVYAIGLTYGGYIARCKAPQCDKSLTYGLVDFGESRLPQAYTLHDSGAQCVIAH
jgi:hypothetical protein